MVATLNLRPLCLSNRTLDLLQCDNRDESALQTLKERTKTHFFVKIFLGFNRVCFVTVQRVGNIFLVPVGLKIYKHLC